MSFGARTKKQYIMSLVTKEGFSLEELYQVIKKYDFPITDVNIAVNFLNELPKNCNVDLPDGVKFDNIRGAVLSEGEYNLSVLCDDTYNAQHPFKIHLVFKDISVAPIDGHHKAIIIRSGKETTGSDMYIINDVMIIHPTTADLYDGFSRKYSI